MDYPVLTTNQLAQALKGWRKARGLTQAAAGAQVGLLPKTLSALESDPGASSVATLFKLLSALDLELVLRPKAKGGESRPMGEW
jgi:HTH-type transcriptional regulator/antitoxin HipB